MSSKNEKIYYPGTFGGFEVRQVVVSGFSLVPRKEIQADGSVVEKKMRIRRNRVDVQILDDGEVVATFSRYLARGRFRYSDDRPGQKIEKFDFDAHCVREVSRILGVPPEKAKALMEPEDYESKAIV